jgi:hypothetical protein
MPWWLPTITDDRLNNPIPRTTESIIFILPKPFLNILDGKVFFANRSSKVGKTPADMGPFGNDEEVEKLMKYGIEQDKKRLMDAGILPKPDTKLSPQIKKKPPFSSN